MIWLLISILTNTILLLLLKSFSRFGVSTLQAIVCNYFVAGALGWWFAEQQLTLQELLQQSWIWVPPVMGMLFITVFLVVARSAQTIGVALTTVANKMSVVIPVVLAIWLYGDPLTPTKVMGIFLALVSVWMSTPRSESNGDKSRQLSWFPIIIFIGSGIIDALANYAQQKLVMQSATSLFVGCCFLIAFCIGLIIVLVGYWRGKEKFSWRTILAGIALGVPNYFSIWSLIRALNTNILDSSTLYPLNNMGIVLCSALAAAWFFQERLQRVNWLGIAFAVVAIAVLMF
jgi:drug/metabolite transporter (DMT)-like permease